MNKHSEFARHGNTDAARHTPPAKLTARQQEVLVLLCQGLSNKKICRHLNRSDATVKTHVASILRSLGVSSRLEAAVIAYAHGLVALHEPAPARATPPWEARWSKSAPAPA